MNTDILGFENTEYHFLSNFYYNDEDTEYSNYWKTNEHYYQAAKTADIEHWRGIVDADTPAKAKKLGRMAPCRPDWEDVKIDVMLGGLRLKFAPNTRLATKLLLTGNGHLEEVNWWGDKFWGTCRGEGLNWLGKCLMMVREEIR